jgi:hypothetical protein
MRKLVIGSALATLLAPPVFVQAYDPGPGACNVNNPNATAQPASEEHLTGGSKAGAQTDDKILAFGDDFDSMGHAEEGRPVASAGHENIAHN